MEEQECALLRMTQEKETENEIFIRYSEDNGEVMSLFDFNEKQVARNHHLPREMKRIDSSGDYIFQVDPAYSYLHNMELHQILPSVSVKKEHRKKLQIAWCFYPGLNVTDKAVMLSGEKKVLSSFVKHWGDIEYQYYKSNKEEHYTRYLGHIPVLNEWSHILPRFSLRVQQPWPFTRGLPFRIFRLKDKISFSYTMKKDIFSLLRVRIFNSSSQTWVPCKVTKSICKYLDFHDKGSLSPPIMIAEYSKITPEEEKEIAERSVRYIIEDVKHFGLPVLEKDKTTQTVEITLDDPIKAIFYIAENYDATLLNNHSNYSTNADDPLEGERPIKSIYPYYKGSPLVPFSSEFTPEVFTDYCESSYPRSCFPGFPRDPGYGVIPIGYDMISPIHESFKSGTFKINFTLQDKDPLNMEDDPEEIMGLVSANVAETSVLRNKYCLHLFALYLKVITIDKDGELKIGKN
jgi:hypothetical protein